MPKLLQQSEHNCLKFLAKDFQQRHFQMKTKFSPQISIPRQGRGEINENQKKIVKGNKSKPEQVPLHLKQTDSLK